MKVTNPPAFDSARPPNARSSTGSSKSCPLRMLLGVAGESGDMASGSSGFTREVYNEPITPNALQICPLAADA